jgi:hypothetical protein
VCPADTDPKVWEKYLELLRQMTPGDRVLRTLELSDFVRRLAEEHKTRSERSSGIQAASTSSR